MTVGENIYKARKEKGITQEELANKIGVKRSIISKYENGSVQISTSTLKKIADVLEVSPTLLIDWEPIENAFQKWADNYCKNNLIDAFDKLNEEGQKVAVERVEELTEISKYTKSDKE